MSSVALIFGGPSPEHPVSLCSAKNIWQALKSTSFQVFLLGVTRQCVWKLIQAKSLEETSFQNPLILENQGSEVELINRKGKVFVFNPENKQSMGPIECAFPIIHGNFGEDGQLQSQLNELGLPFVGSDSTSCKNAFDKALTKDLINRKTRVPQTPYLRFTHQEPHFDKVVSQLGLPLFVKPARTGSSIGISKVHDQKTFDQAVSKAKVQDEKIIIEKAISGRELECAILEEEQIRVTDLGEIKPKHEFYSYEAKYLDPRGAELIIPAKVDPNLSKKIQDYAKICFQNLECRDYARVDFFLSEKGEIFFNEINTHPGFTDISQFPLLWEQQGVSFRDLILRLLQRTLERK